MKKSKKKDSRKYGALVVICIVLLLSVLAAIAYWTTPSYTKANDSTGEINFEYPEDWVTQEYKWKNCCHGPEKKEPNWQKVTQPIVLSPAENDEVTVSISEEKYGDYWKSFKALREDVDEDYFATVLFDGMREDGHEALFVRVDYIGPPDANVESFTDHRYYFDKHDSVLMVEFREKYHHDWPDDEMGPDIDNTEYLDEFERIANSIMLGN